MPLRRAADPGEDAHVNLIRVWGGGLYESDDFYDLCDELGLLVWQDFLLACAAYAEEEPLRSEIVAEAREAVTRLSPHPSLALWNGGNENLWGYARLGLAGRARRPQLGPRLLLRRCFPSIVAELDPSRPYSPGSPYSPDPALHPNDPAHGTMHIWDVWNTADYTVYRDYRPRFAVRVRLPGPADLVDPAPAPSTTTRSARTRPACWPTRRRRTATASWPGASTGTCPSRSTSTTGTGPRRSTRRAPSPPAWSTSAR